MLPSAASYVRDLTAAIDTFDTIITDYVDVKKSTAMDYEWSSAAQDLYDGNAAMLFHGDWAKGYLVHGRFSPERLSEAVHIIHEGGALITPMLAPALLEFVRAGAQGGRRAAS